MFVDIDDVIGAVHTAQMCGKGLASDFREKQKARTPGGSEYVALEATAKMFEKQAERLGKLLEKIEAIHEAGHDYLVGVVEV